MCMLKSSILSDTGLGYRWLKLIGGSLILFGVLLGDPPITATPTDLLNPVVAKYLVSWFTIDSRTALIYSYTLLPLIIIPLGITIYPKQNGALFHSLVNRAKGYIHKVTATPPRTAVTIALLYIAYTYYVPWLFSVV